VPPPTKKSGKIFFGQLSCKIRAFFGHISCKKIGHVDKFFSWQFSGNDVVKLGYFLNFSCIIFGQSWLSAPTPINYRPCSEATGNRAGPKQACRPIAYTYPGFCEASSADSCCCVSAFITTGCQQTDSTQFTQRAATAVETSQFRTAAR